MRTVLACSLLLAATLTVACTSAPPPAPPAPAPPIVDDPASIAAIGEARKAFMAAYEAGDAAAIGQLYMPNAVSEPNFQPTLEGRDAIAASVKNMFEQVSVKATLDAEETRTLGNVGLDRGHYTVTVTPKAGAPPTTSEGRYLVVYVKDTDGKWRVSHDIDNVSMPPAPPAATAPRAPAAPAASKQ